METPTVKNEGHPTAKSIERWDLQNNRTQIRAHQMELLELVTALESDITELGDLIESGGLPAFSGFSSTSKGQDYEYVIKALHQLEYDNQQDSSKSLVFPGLVAVDARTALSIEKVNDKKKQLKTQLMTFDKISIRDSGHWSRLSDYLLKEIQHRRLHRIQAYRLLTFENVAIQRATFFWQKVKRSRNISIEAIIGRLESMQRDALVSADLDKIRACAQDERFSLITTEGDSPAVNLLPERTILKDSERQQLLRDHSRLIVSANGRPFSDLSAATTKASILSEELGEVYEVVNLGDHRYGLFPITLQPEICAKNTSKSIRWIQRAATMPIFYLADNNIIPYLKPMETSPEFENKTPRQPRQNTRLEAEPFLSSIAVYRHR